MRDELQNITLEEIEKQSEKARDIDSEEFTRFISERMSRPHFYEIIDSYSYHNKLKAIRAEIQNIELSGYVDERTMFVRTAGQVKQMVLDIIDRHMKGESE